MVVSLLLLALPLCSPAKELRSLKKIPLAVISLTSDPAEMVFSGPRETAHLLITAHLKDGSAADVTSDTLKSFTANPLVKRNSAGEFEPIKDGKSTITLYSSGKKVAVRIVVSGSQLKNRVSFTNDVVPILTHSGCNQGACHGSQFGKGGFKLSLAGFDPDMDFLNIVKQSKGRRIAPADPDRSLVLLKPSMHIPHAGGLRLIKGSSDYKLIREWLSQGTPGPDASDPKPVKLEVYPAERILQKSSPAQPMVILAVFSNGMKRDVTDESRLNTLNDAVASCTPEGVIRAIGRGQTAIMVRYGGQVAVSTIIVPYSGKGAVSAVSSTPKSIAPQDEIDRLVASKQQQLGLKPSPLCDERTFIRRVSFDLIGTPPTRKETEFFIADKDKNKRSKLVDSLLARPEYSDYWTLKWGDLLRSNRTNLGTKGMWSFTNWIHSKIKQNQPMDQFARELITAKGSTFTNGPSNYYRVAKNPSDLAETTSQVFLGLRLQCSKCHHHPFERWSQADYYQFAAFFARVGLKSSNEFGIFGNEEIVRVNESGEVNHPKTGAVMYPTPPGVKIAALSGGKQPDPDANGDRRFALADWLVDKNNRLFARNIANRYWGYLFAKGIVNPIDDQRVTNPPTNEPLLDYLANEFVRNNFDVKLLLREMCLSKTYQRSSAATAGNRDDELFFTHYLPRRLPAESLLDAIDMACGTREKFPALPLGTKAIQLPDPGVSSDFLDVFGRPLRAIACECERSSEPNLSQTLRMMNGELVNRKIGEGDGRIAKLIAAKHSDSAIIDDLYTAVLCRPPSRRERNEVLGILAFSGERKPVYEDVLLTLLNSKEFLFNH